MAFTKDQNTWLTDTQKSAVSYSEASENLEAKIEMLAGVTAKVSGIQDDLQAVGSRLEVKFKGKKQRRTFSYRLKCAIRP